MSAVMDISQEQDLNLVAPSFNALMLDTGSMDKMLRVADLMASSKVTIPSHLRNSPGDCLAVVMQAMQWGMNPFSVAQKTHLSQGGALGYEAQLINAVIVANGALKGQPEFEFIGDWKKVLGKVEERKSDKGGKYYVPTYTKSDEDGLGVICRATLRGEDKPREITVMLSQCYPRFSTQWATDPQQQITYVAVRKFGRRYAPGAILGVYTKEELDSDVVVERDMGSAEVVPPQPLSAEKFAENKEAWKKVVESGRKTPDQMIIFLEGKAPLTDAQKKEIHTWGKKPAAPTPAPASAPAPAPAPAASPTPAEPVDDDFTAALDKSGDYTPQ